MSKYRHKLPQLGGRTFLTDGGLETTLIFHDKIDLPCFASFDLLRTQAGRQRLRAYYDQYAAIAKANGAGFILEGVTWRASPDWGHKLGYSKDALAIVNREAVDLMREVRDAHATERSPMVISACIGPRGDGYDPGQIMTPAEAQAYHAFQIDIFQGTDADMVTAMTITNVNEAIGVTRAAQAAGMPVVISFTLETDGRLPTGQTLRDAIEEVDGATGSGPAYYMINCAHPDHFAATLAAGGTWCRRIRGIRANASRLSHAELDAATELDAGDPAELGRQYRQLLDDYPHMTVFGGCCGTDHRHVEQIGMACLNAA